MPRARPPENATERTRRRLARAKAKRLAKARERAAKAEGVVLDRSETLRQRKLEKAELSEAEFAPILRVLERRLREKWQHVVGHQSASRKLDSRKGRKD